MFPALLLGLGLAALAAFLRGDCDQKPAEPKAEPKPPAKKKAGAKAPAEKPEPTDGAP